MAGKKVKINIDGKTYEGTLDETSSGTSLVLPEWVGTCCIYINRKIKSLIIDKLFNDKKKCVFITVFALCIALLFVLLACLTSYSMNERIKIARYIYNDYAMGEAYAEWQQALNYMEFEDSKEYWNKVQKDWKTQGLSVSWKYVCQVYEESVENGIPFNTCFRGAFSRDFYSYNYDVLKIYYAISMAWIAVALLSLYFLKKAKKT